MKSPPPCNGNMPSEYSTENKGEAFEYSWIFKSNQQSNKYSKIGKQQFVLLNGDSIYCNSLENNEVLTCDVRTSRRPKPKSKCIHIRENRWYDATNIIPIGLKESNFHEALENISFAYDSADKQIYNLGENHITDKDSLRSDDSISSSDVKITFESCILRRKQESNGDSPKYQSLPHSCSSTVSSLSELSPSKSSLNSEESHSTLGKVSKLWPFNSSLIKNIFLQKPIEENSPKRVVRNLDKIGGSLALIQLPRPAHLPAKSVYEEENHKKQYQAIIEAARKRIQREEKERRLQREEQMKIEKRLTDDLYLWNVHVLPNFEGIRSTRKVRELWWRGIPPSIRGRVWKLAIHNDLNITNQLYNLCLERALSNQNNETLFAIKLDVSRTFPLLCVFQNGGPLSGSLQNILAAYAVYRPDIGYVQGMSFIGAVLLLNMNTIDAFTCYANILNRPCHRLAFSIDQLNMNIYYKVFTNILAIKLPKIHSHFISSGLSADLYLLDWIYTIYAKAMPLDITCRIWDVFLRDGEEFLFRAALGILHLYQEELLHMDFIRGAQFLSKLPENIRIDALFNSISQMTTNVGSTTFHQMLVKESSTC